MHSRAMLMLTPSASSTQANTARERGEMGGENPEDTNKVTHIRSLMHSHRHPKAPDRLFS